MSPRRVPSALPALLALVALSACQSSENLQPSAAGVLVSAEPLEITLANSLRRWKETAEAPGSQTRYRLGTLFARLFPAHDGRAFLSPLETSLESGPDAAGLAFEARYRFTLALQLDGQNHEVRAEGAGRSSGDVRAAERAALEACVGEIYDQVAVLLARKGR